MKFAFEYGVLGVSVFILALAVRTMYRNSRADRSEHAKAIADKDALLCQTFQRLSEEQRMRVEDAKRFTEVALKLQSEVISSVASIEKASAENAKLCKFVERLVDTVEELIQERGRTPFGRKR